MTDQGPTPTPMPLQSTLRPTLFSGLSHALDTHTAIFDAFITQETEKATASCQTKLAHVEAQLKEAQDELESLQRRLSTPQLDLLQQLEAAKEEVKAREVEIDRTRNAAKRLISFFRRSTGKLTALQEEAEKKLSDTSRQKEDIQAELDELRLVHDSKMQVFERNKRETSAAEHRAKQETEALRAVVAEQEKLLAGAQSSEESLRIRVQELGKELATLEESSRAERTRLFEEKKRAETDFAAKLEAAISESAEYRTKAEEASAQCQDSTTHVRLVVEELDRLRRESGSIITALQRQVEGATLASNQELTHIQEQLSSLQAQHSRCSSDAEASLIESTRNIERHSRELSGMREAFLEADNARRSAELERDTAKREALRIQSDLASLKLEYGLSLHDFVVLLALLRKDMANYRTAAERYLKDFRRQLIAAQEKGDRTKMDLEKRFSSLAHTLDHHGLVSMNESSYTLQPSPRLLALWEKLHGLLPEHRISPFHFPSELTEETSAVIPAMSTLVDELVYSHNLLQFSLQQTSASRDQSRTDSLDTPLEPPPDVPIPCDEVHVETENPLLPATTVAAAEASQPQTSVPTTTPSPSSPLLSTAVRESLVLKRKRGRPRKNVTPSSTDLSCPDKAILIASENTSGQEPGYHAAKRRRTSEQDVALILTTGSIDDSPSHPLQAEVEGRPEDSASRPPSVGRENSISDEKRPEITTLRPVRVSLRLNPTSTGAKEDSDPSSSELVTRSGRKVQATEAARASQAQQKSSRRRSTVKV
ncbi:hypothetical protein GYMLUDRAFT_719399 [Collybiopsis luxurians FD-317 M1]|nr:hypothetical protein GYMLUDRAFT_719399 [Collybiopsis luxurians FD-317 M1]